MTKLMLLDVDGVLAPLESTDRSTLYVEGDWESWQVLRAATKWIDNLSKNEDVEIRWFTILGERAKPLADAFGFDFPFETFPEIESDQWIKNVRVNEIVTSEDYSKIVWIDDEHDSESRALEAKFDNLELVSVDGSKGMTFTDALNIHLALEIAP